MQGGIMNLKSFGMANVLINGNPEIDSRKTLFTSSYSKHTNFGDQKFRIDYNGARDLRLAEQSEFEFVISRHAHLLRDAHLCITLPNIWSPIYPPTEETNDRWAPYEFKWIENIGAHLIRDVKITCGAYTLAQYSGEYIAAVVGRDYSTEKKRTFDEITGNVAEIHSPEYAYNRINTYPSAYKQLDPATGEYPIAGTEPSIRGRKLNIPLNAWFSHRSQAAFPLVCLDAGVELKITVTLRPIQDLFRVRDVFDPDNSFPYIRPDFNQLQFQMHRFLQTPPDEDVSLGNNAYDNTVNTWNADIHLMTTQTFLEEAEYNSFIHSGTRSYLVKDVYTYQLDNIASTAKIPLNNSTGMVASWMFRFQRNDAFMRNEWDNYTNWPYSRLPGNTQIAPVTGPFQNPIDGRNTGIYLSGDLRADNRREIVQTVAIVLDGAYREKPQTADVYEHMERLSHSEGYDNRGIHYYNFCLDTDIESGQPTGGMNMTKYRKIEIEVSVFPPEIDPVKSEFKIICDGEGNVISTNQSTWKLHEYAYNALVFEERYNLVTFSGGSVGLAYVR